MKILALEFSSAQRSVAVLRPEGMEAEVIETARRTPALEMVETALRETALEREEIECVAVGVGPGSYTGIRAAIALVQGWHLVRQVKILGVSSAECIAAHAHLAGLAGRIHVVLDAQRDELYLAGYSLEKGGFHETAPLRIGGLGEARALEKTGEILVGPEVTRWFASGRIIFPRAAVAARLARARNDFIEAEALKPLYLRETAFVKAPAPRKLGI